MSAQDLWRRLCAAVGGRWHIPDEADMLRLAQLVGERTAERDAAYEAISREVKRRLAIEERLAGLIVANDATVAELAVLRGRSWGCPRCVGVSKPDGDEAARHAEVELRGGR